MAEEKKPQALVDNSFAGNDPRSVEIDSPAERAFWCKTLFTSDDQLVAAVRAVGASAQKVKEYLQANRDL